MVLTIDLPGREYDIVVERACLDRAGELLDLDRKCLIVTDDGVPAGYAEKIAGRCREALTVSVPEGEGSKSMAMLETLLQKMLEAGFTRSDCVIAVGGGVPGDLAGFAAATYMRGIDFYNIPTTLLSQADSSIGGKTAVNLGGVKNIVGAFWQPRRVLIDPDTLDTLPERQKAAGLAEIIKAGLIADAELFRYIEERSGCCPGPEACAAGSEKRSPKPEVCAAGPGERSPKPEACAAGSEKRSPKPEACCLGGLDTEKIIEAALRVKKAVVEADEREGGLRRILNFGHTIGHGIESRTGLLHGESVAVGMLPMCAPEIGQRLQPVLERAGLPVSAECDPEEVFAAVMHDKKFADGEVRAVYVGEAGRAEVIGMTADELRSRIDSVCYLNSERSSRRARTSVTE